MDVQVLPLLTLTPIDAPPKFLQSLVTAGQIVKKLRETDSDIVNSQVNRSGNEEDHRALQAGLLYLALTEPDPRHSFCTDIVLTSRDNLTYVLSEMARLVAETWPKMASNVRFNLLALLREFIATRDANVEVLMVHLYRRMTTGDLSSQNLWLIDNVLDLLEKNKDWLSSTERQHFLLPLSIYTLLRLIPDHCQNSLQTSAPINSGISQTPICISSLRQRELTLVEELLRKHFDRCALFGRDLIRLLHGVARLDPIKKLWDDILQNFSSISSHFSSLAEVLDITTPQYFTQTFIPHEMEQWIKWFMKNVHCVPGVPVQRYQDFFQRRFFATPESQSLRVCLLRYVVTFFHPTNIMLASTLIPRWNVCSWILSQSTCPVVIANAKLALFYDWLFYKPNGSVMNLEPALLAIRNHLAPRSQLIALSLVDFLVKIAGTYHPPMTHMIVRSIRDGLEDMTRVGVIKTINPILEMLHRCSPELLRSFRSLLGIEQPTVPISNTPPVLTPDVASHSPLLDKWNGSNDSSTTPPITTQCVSTVSYATTSLGLKSKLTESDNGSPTDPRLTRGHAAILAGAVSPTPTSLENLPKGIISLTELSSSTTSTVTNMSQPASPLQTAPLDEPKAPSLVISRLSPQQFPNPRVPPRLTEMFVPEEPLDKLEIDMSSLNPSHSRTASWSPPPVDSSNSGSSKPNKKTLDTEFDNPDSMESTIDDLRRRFLEYQLRFHYFVEPVDINPLIELLEGPIRMALERFRDVAKRVGLIHQTATGLSSSGNPTNLDSRSSNTQEEKLASVKLRSAAVLSDLCEAMEALVQAVLDDDSFDDLEIAGRTAAVVCELLFGLFAERLMPIGVEWSEEHLEDCLNFPIFIPFRYLWQMNPGDPKRELLLLLLTEMQARQPRLGYHLLFFLKISKLNDEKMTLYRNFCVSQENPNLRDSLFKDMQLLADDNRRLFAYLLPEVFTMFSDELANDAEFLHLIVATVDPGMCNTLISEIVRGHLNLFPQNDLTTILNASLRWNSIEQFFFWQLINAHEIPTRLFLPLIRSIEPMKHPEACANLILLLKLEKPNSELVRALLSRPGPNDSLSVTALHFWSCPDNQHASRFSSILSTLINTHLTSRKDTVLMSSATSLSSSNSTMSRDPREKRRNATAKQQPPTDNPINLFLILTHLDSIRRTCKNISILEDEDIQTSLQTIATSPKVPTSVKDQFSDLLALAEDQPSDYLVDSARSMSTKSALSGDARLHFTGDDDRSKNKSTTGLERSSPSGKKGGHSLRNLDSRRAAEAERRRTGTSSNNTSGSKRTNRNGTSSSLNSSANDNDDLEDNDDESELISLVSSTGSSSSSSGDEDDDSKSSSNRKTRRSRPNSSKTSDKSHGSGSGSSSRSKASNRKRLVESSKDRKHCSKVPRLELDDILNKSDDDDDEDEEKNLEVVMIDDEDSGGESTSQKAGETEADDDVVNKPRPSKRRKTAIKRFMLDD